MESQEKVTPGELAILREIRDKSNAVMVTNQRPVQANTQTLYYYEPCAKNPTTTTTTTSTTKAPMATNTTACPGSSNTATSSSSDKFDMGTFIGAIIGCVLGGLLIGAVLTHVYAMNNMCCYGNEKVEMSGASSPRNQFQRAPSTEDNRESIQGARIL